MSNLCDNLRTNLCGFCVHEYCFHTYIWTIIVKCRFLFYPHFI